MKEIKLFGRQILSWGEEGSKIGRSVKHAISTESSQYRVGTLSLEMLRRVALSEPLVLKAMQKKNKDIFRNWFEIISKENDEKLSVRIENIIKDFEELTRIQYKLYVSGICSNIYGTGFIEVIYNNDKDRPAYTSPSPNARPVNLRVLNPEFIKERKKRDNADPILYWVYRENSQSDEIFFHPDRIIDVAVDRLPFNDFGISKINILKNILESKMNADIAAGETLAWFSTGILDMKIEGMDDEQEKAMLKLFKEHPHYYVHDEDYELDIKNPTRIDPKPFYDYFYANIAAGMEMPVSLLVGSGGGGAGMEYGITDYYHDIENMQEIIFAPIIVKLYTQLLKSYGFHWNYRVKWNPIFVDELAEAKILQARSYTAVNAYNAGIIDISESRDMLVNGIVELDINKAPKIKPISPTGAPSQPNVEPQPAEKKPTAKIQSEIKPLSQLSKAMIEEAAKRERELGESVLKEQEEIFKEKPKRKRKKNG